MRAYGLQTHIWDNNLKSILLLAGFPLLLLLLTYALFLLYAGLTGDFAGADAPTMAQPFVWAAAALAQAWPFALIAAGIWFAIAFFANQAIIDAATGAKRVTRQEAPQLYNLLENLCISRGIPMPALRMIDTDALNAFASGLHSRSYSVTLTKGLVDTLEKDELEAVLAHELTHIRNGDVRLLVVATVFVGIFSVLGELSWRGLNGMNVSSTGRRSSSSSSSSSNDRGGSGGAAIVAILAALALIAISYALAIVIRFALSRRREFLADAGAAELTKNPDALVSALRKIEGRSSIPRAPAEIREMFFENRSEAMASLFATHPTIEARIKALQDFAGARPEEPPKNGPWGS
jgi:heat shock protein HtpX